jgi:integrase
LDGYGQTVLSALTSAVADQALAGLALRRAGGTVRNYGVTLKTALGWAVRRARILAVDPLAGWTIRYRIATRTRVLTDEQVDALCAALPREDYRDLVRVMLSTGLRISDAVALRWDSVQDGRLRLPQAKTGEDLFVPLSAAALAILEAIPRDEGVDRVFPAINRNTFENVLAAAGGRTGVPCTAHDFRRTFATRLYLAGVPREIIAKLLGQRGTSMVHHYTHADWTTLSEMVNR